MTTDEEPVVSVGLSKDEAKVYRYIIRHYEGRGTDALVAEKRDYLSARRLDFPPEHYVDLAIMSADMGSKELKDMYTGESTDAPVLEVLEGMLTKLANEMKRSDAVDTDRVAELMKANADNPYS